MSRSVNWLVFKPLEQEKPNFFSSKRSFIQPWVPRQVRGFVFIDSLMGCVNQTGAKVVFISPFPRYPIACCAQSGHFCAGYDGNLFNADVVRLGTYISRLQSFKDVLLLTGLKISVIVVTGSEEGRCWCCKINNQKLYYIINCFWCLCCCYWVINIKKKIRLKHEFFKHIYTAFVYF